MRAVVVKTKAVQRLGRYELLKPLGAGGMAQVWLARRRAQDGVTKTVAVKVLAPGLAADPRYQAMFRAEMRTSMWLSHSNIVQVFDCGVESGQAYIVMEWVDGVTLAALLENWRERHVDIPLDVVSLVISALLRALSYAHDLRHEGVALGLVHRDISPQNVLLSVSGEVKLTDFGIARIVTEETSSTQPKGKLRYMAPEQLRGATVDRRADLYAVGALLHELLSGEKFRRSGSQEELFQLAWQGTMPDLPRTVPSPFEELRRSLLAADPQQRPRDASAAMRALVWQAQPGDPEGWLAEWVRQVSGVGSPRSGIEGAVVRPIAVSQTDATATSLPHGEPAALSPAGEFAPYSPLSGHGLTPTSRYPDGPNLAEAANLVDVPESSSSAAQRAHSLPLVAAAVAAYPPPTSSVPVIQVQGTPTPLPAMPLTDESDEGMPLRSRRAAWLWTGMVVSAVMVMGVWSWRQRDDNQAVALTPSSLPPGGLVDSTSATTLHAAGSTKPTSNTAEQGNSTDSTRSASHDSSPLPAGADPRDDAVAPPHRVVEPDSAPHAKKAKAEVDVVVKADQLGFAYVKIGRQQVLAEPTVTIAVTAGRHAVAWRQNPSEAWQPAGFITVRRDEPLVVRFGENGALRVSVSR